MPVVIDLCSSPGPATTKTKRIAASAPAAAHAITSKPWALGKVNDDWPSLSSDDDAEPSLPGPSIPKAARPESIAATKPNVSRTLNPAVSQSKVDDDFFFFSDDFDSTAYLDNSVMALPQANKPRLSRSPKAAPSKLTGLKRSVSNIDAPSRFVAPASKRSKAAVDDDDIVSTSSPNPFLEAVKRRKQKRKDNQALDVTDDVFSRECRKAEEDVSSDEDFPDIDAMPLRSPAPKKSPKRNSSETALAKYNKVKAAQKKADEKAEASKAKAQARKDKEAGREAEKARKAQEKEDKKRNKEKSQELAKVNISRNDKKTSSPEMIVDMSSGLDTIVAEQVKLFLGPLEIEHSTWHELLPVVKWRRKVTARYDEKKGHWEPTAPHIKPEQHIIYVMSAKDFVERATGDEGADLDIHFLQLKAKFDSCQIIYLIEGLMSWMKKNQNLKNRQYTDAVISQMPQGEPTASQRRKKKEPEYVDETMLEDALLRLQVIHGAMIHHVPVKIDTSQWIVNFTQHISTIPYKTQKDLLDTAFCMDSGQVKSGEDTKDTYCKMLQEIIRITAPIAYGIMAEYPSVQELVKGLQEDGPLALEDCRKMANRDGAFTDKRVGPAISKRMHSVFMGRDPKSFDV